MNIKKKLAISGLVLCAVVLSGTLVSVAFLQNDQQLGTDEKKNGDNNIIGTGTIRYLDFEGGFFGIISDDDQQYLPFELPEEYQQDGLRVTFTVEKLEGQFSIHMWGELVEIVDIALLV